MSGQSDESDAHQIIGKRSLSQGVKRYTCSCTQTIDAHPDLLDEAFTFHLTRVSPLTEDRP